MKEQTGVMMMSEKELSRLEVIQQLSKRHISQVEAAKRLRLSTRQVRRLHTDYINYGTKALISKKRNHPSNNQLSKTHVEQALNLLRSEYQGFGPTFAQEKLLERDNLKFSVESLRKLMTAQGLWTPKQRKKIRHHQMRMRRSSLGELVQIDGSPHDWFEGRGERCCLLVFIDDATSRIQHLRFTPNESTQGYFDATEAYIKQYGRPLAFYSDKHAIFRVHIPEAKDSTGETQFGRALTELDIELICAHSPQAKGRVERANKTLQDRLIKEMRLRKISCIEQANEYTAEFIEQHNQRFAVEPACLIDRHRTTIPNEENCQFIFSHQTTRTLSKNLELSYNNLIYQIQTSSKSYHLRNAKVTVNDRKGQVTLTYKEKTLVYKTFDKHNRPASIVDTKQLNRYLDKRATHKPKSNHPWRNYPVKINQHVAV